MRSLTQLQQECEAAHIPIPEGASRVQLMDLLREVYGAFDKTTELDPMKAKDLKHSVDWTISLEEGRYNGIRSYFTEDWCAEPKLDGCRLRLFLGLSGNTMNTGRRSVKTFQYQNRTDNFPHLRDAIWPDFAGTIIDGEIIAPRPDITTHTGMTTNSLLNASVALCNSNPADSVRTQAKYGAAQFWAFDIMMYQGEDVTLAHYIERKRLLRSVVEMLELQHPDCSIKYVPAYESSATVIQKMIDVGYEGAMLKSKTGAYQYGKRSPHWLKVKGFSTMDAFITGYEPGNGGFEGYVGSICFSVMNPDGTFFEAGKFGNLEFEVRALMSAEDGSLKPEYYGRVVEIMAQARTKTNRLRHAHLVRWRPDKEPQDCGLDQLDLIARA